MKLAHLAALAIASILFAACVGPETPSERSARAVNREHSRRENAEYRRSHDNEPLGHGPRVGMTKAQIEDMYGEPNSKNHTARGEVWTYWFNRGHAFIPYNFGYRARTGIFMFDQNGRLRDYSWNE